MYHTIFGANIGAKGVSVAGTLPMGCRHVRHSNHSHIMFSRTMITAHRACKVRLKVGAWVVFLGLIAVSVETLVFVLHAPWL
jgi:hypothetical protein